MSEISPSSASPTTPTIQLSRLITVLRKATSFTRYHLSWPEQSDRPVSIQSSLTCHYDPDNTCFHVTNPTSGQKLKRIHLAQIVGIYCGNFSVLRQDDNVGVEHVEDSSTHDSTLSPDLTVLGGYYRHEVDRADQGVPPLTYVDQWISMIVDWARGPEEYATPTYVDYECFDLLASSSRLRDVWAMSTNKVIQSLTNEDGTPLQCDFLRRVVNNTSQSSPQPQNQTANQDDSIVSSSSSSSNGLNSSRLSMSDLNIVESQLNSSNHGHERRPSMAVAELGENKHSDNDGDEDDGYVTMTYTKKRSDKKKSNLLTMNPLASTNDTPFMSMPTSSPVSLPMSSSSPQPMNSAGGPYTSNGTSVMGVLTVHSWLEDEPVDTLTPSPLPPSDSTDRAVDDIRHRLEKRMEEGRSALLKGVTVRIHSKPQLALPHSEDASPSMTEPVFSSVTLVTGSPQEAHSAGQLVWSTPTASLNSTPPLQNKDLSEAYLAQSLPPLEPRTIRDIHIGKLTPRLSAAVAMADQHCLTIVIEDQSTKSNSNSSHSTESLHPSVTAPSTFTKVSIWELEFASVESRALFLSGLLSTLVTNFAVADKHILNASSLSEQHERAERVTDELNSLGLRYVSGSSRVFVYSMSASLDQSRLSSLPFNQRTPSDTVLFPIIPHPPLPPFPNNTTTYATRRPSLATGLLASSSSPNSSLRPALTPSTPHVDEKVAQVSLVLRAWLLKGVAFEILPHPALPPLPYPPSLHVVHTHSPFPLAPAILRHWISSASSHVARPLRRNSHQLAATPTAQGGVASLLTARLKTVNALPIHLFYGPLTPQDPRVAPTLPPLATSLTQRRGSSDSGRNSFGISGSSSSSSSSSTSSSFSLKPQALSTFSTSLAEHDVANRDMGAIWWCTPNEATTTSVERTATRDVLVASGQMAIPGQPTSSPNSSSPLPDVLNEGVSLAQSNAFNEGAYLPLRYLRAICVDQVAELLFLDDVSLLNQAEAEQEQQDKALDYTSSHPIPPSSSTVKSIKEETKLIPLITLVFHLPTSSSLDSPSALYAVHIRAPSQRYRDMWVTAVTSLFRAIGLTPPPVTTTISRIKSSLLSLFRITTPSTISSPSSTSSSSSSSSMKHSLHDHSLLITPGSLSAPQQSRTRQWTPSKSWGTRTPPAFPLRRNLYSTPSTPASVKKIGTLTRKTVRESLDEEAEDSDRRRRGEGKEEADYKEQIPMRGHGQPSGQAESDGDGYGEGITGIERSDDDAHNEQAAGAGIDAEEGARNALAMVPLVDLPFVIPRDIPPGHLEFSIAYRNLPSLRPDATSEIDSETKTPSAYLAGVFERSLDDKQDKFFGHTPLSRISHAHTFPTTFSKEYHPTKQQVLQINLYDIDMTKNKGQASAEDWLAEAEVGLDQLVTACYQSGIKFERKTNDQKNNHPQRKGDSESKSDNGGDGESEREREGESKVEVLVTKVRIPLSMPRELRQKYKKALIAYSDDDRERRRSVKKVARRASLQESEINTTLTPIAHHVTKLAVKQALENTPLAETLPGYISRADAKHLRSVAKELQEAEDVYMWLMCTFVPFDADAEAARNVIKDLALLPSGDTQPKRKDVDNHPNTSTLKSSASNGALRLTLNTSPTSSAENNNSNNSASSSSSSSSKSNPANGGDDDKRNSIAKVNSNGLASPRRSLVPIGGGVGASRSGKITMILTPEREKVLSDGFVVTKFAHKDGACHERLVWYDTGRHCLAWNKVGKKRFEDSKCIPIAFIADVIKGKITYVMTKFEAAKRLHPMLCVSIVQHLVLPSDRKDKDKDGLTEMKSAASPRALPTYGEEEVAGGLVTATSGVFVDHHATRKLDYSRRMDRTHRTLDLAFATTSDATEFVALMQALLYSIRPGGKKRASIAAL